MLTDNNKRAVYDQLGEEGLKGSRSSQGAGGPGGFSGFPSGSTFTFTSGPGGGGFSSSGGFAPTDPQKVFEYVSLILISLIAHSTDFSTGNSLGPLSSRVEEDQDRCSVI